MNQENKFREYWKKFLEYWQAFLTQCGVYWEKAKVYGKKAKKALKKFWAAIRRNGRRLLQKLAAWLLAIHEKLQPRLQQAGEWCAGILDRFPAIKRSKSEAIPPVEAKEEPHVLPQPAEVPAPAAPKLAEADPNEAPEAVPADAAAEKELPQWMSIPWVAKTLAVLGIIGSGIKLIVKWIWKLRKVIMAIPVVWAAVKFAMQNMDRLPEQVGLDIQSTGEFATMISREAAVYWPLGITAFCLLLMFCSKKPILPWVISIFTLVLPWLIWLLNYYA